MVTVNIHSSSTNQCKRAIELNRQTKETTIELSLNLDGSGKSNVKTGIGFLDHMLMSLAKHGLFDLTLICKGDLHVDDHHSAEDCAIILGEALRQALGDGRGINRFASAYAPLDEALVRAVVDLSGRPWPVIDLNFNREMIGQIATENLTHFFQSLAMNGRFNLHIQVLAGENDHHKAEAAFKALALALRAAVRLDHHQDIPSVKGVIS